MIWFILPWTFLVLLVGLYLGAKAGSLMLAKQRSYLVEAVRLTEETQMQSTDGRIDPTPVLGHLSRMIEMLPRTRRNGRQY